MDYEIVWTGNARTSFNEIIDYLLMESPSAAERMRLELIETIANLERFPHIGPVYEPDKQKRVREVVCVPYRIFYRILPRQSKIVILLIRHASRDEPSLATLLHPNDIP
jgi:toxin ParE1/3/4